MSKNEPRVFIKKDTTQIDFVSSKIKNYAGSAIKKLLQARRQDSVTGGQK